MATIPDQREGSHASSRKRSPRRTLRATFTAQGSSTALSVLLTPALPNCTSPSQAATLLAHLIDETKALNRRKRSLSSFPVSNLKWTPATTAPYGSLRPFRPEQILNSYAVSYRPPFAFSAFSYPLPQQLPLRVTCRASMIRSFWRRIGLTTFPILPTR